MGASDGGLTPVSISVDEREAAPRPRGWLQIAPADSASSLIHGGLSGDDAAPERLNDSWLLHVSAT